MLFCRIIHNSRGESRCVNYASSVTCWQWLGVAGRVVSSGAKILRLTDISKLANLLQHLVERKKEILLLLHLVLVQY